MIRKLLQRLFLPRPQSARDELGTQSHGLMNRRWKLLQVESAMSCNLRCIMCPWIDVRDHLDNKALMRPEIWESLRRHLPEVISVDFTGGGEPLLQPLIPEWINDAKSAGCEAGLLTNGLLLSRSKAEALISAGLDWLCVSIDGADKSTYERIRQGSDFDIVCKNLEQVSKLRRNGLPKTMINFVIMSANFHQIEDIVKLASKLGVDHVNMKQCEVIRGTHGRDCGLFGPNTSPEIKKREALLKKAVKLAKRLGLVATLSPFIPSERPVCDQDPRGSMFVAYDGTVGPCINAVYGGPTTFLGKDAFTPTIHYGRIPEKDLLDIWNSETCKFYRVRFSERCHEYESTFMDSLMSNSHSSPERIHESACKRMPNAPETCRVCHYLYGV